MVMTNPGIEERLSHASEISRVALKQPWICILTKWSIVCHYEPVRWEQEDGVMQTHWFLSLFSLRVFQETQMQTVWYTTDSSLPSKPDSCAEEGRAVRPLYAHPIPLCGCITILTAVELSRMQSVVWRINCSSGGLVSKLHIILILFSYCMFQSFKIGPWIFYKTWIKDPSQIH